jgi:hypothetical protein
MKMLLLLNLLLSSVLLLAAETQPTLTYQGRLKNLSTPTTALNHTLPIRFALYTQPQGGDPLWQEIVAVTPNSDGLFTTTLFEGCGVKLDPAGKTFAEALLQGQKSNALYLGLTIGEDSTQELSPRHAIGIVPRAHRARFSYRAQNTFTIPKTLSAQSLSASTITTPTCTIGTNNEDLTLQTLSVRNALSAQSLIAENAVKTNGALTLNGDVTSSDLAPLGAIILWYGDKANLPQGWEVCQELSGRFPLGADATTTLNSQGGAKTLTLSLAQLPAHTHTLHYTQPSSTSGSTWLVKDVDWNEETWAKTSSTPITLASPQPNTQPFERMPPYKALYYIRRVQSHL